MADCLYTPTLADEICRLMTEGRSVRSICSDPGMPSEGTVRGWAREDRDGFAARYRLARDLQLDHWADLIVDLADRSDRDPRDRQIRIDTRKWIMSKLGPRRYGERLLTAIELDSPIKVLHDQINLAALSPEQLDAVENLAMAMLVQKGGD
jgi:hypothetical protein